MERHSKADGQLHHHRSHQRHRSFQKDVKVGDTVGTSTATGRDHVRHLRHELPGNDPERGTSWTSSTSRRARKPPLPPMPFPTRPLRAWSPVSPLQAPPPAAPPPTPLPSASTTLGDLLPGMNATAEIEIEQRRQCPLRAQCGRRPRQLRACHQGFAQLPPTPMTA